MGHVYARGVGNPPLPSPLPSTVAFFDLGKTAIAQSSTLRFSNSFYRGGRPHAKNLIRSAGQHAFSAGRCSEWPVDQTFCACGDVLAFGQDTRLGPDTDADLSVGRYPIDAGVGGRPGYVA